MLLGVVPAVVLAGLVMLAGMLADILARVAKLGPQLLHLLLCRHSMGTQHGHGISGLHGSTLTEAPVTPVATDFSSSHQGSRHAGTTPQAADSFAARQWSARGTAAPLQPQTEASPVCDLHTQHSPRVPHVRHTSVCEVMVQPRHNLDDVSNQVAGHLKGQVLPHHSAQHLLVPAPSPLSASAPRPSYGSGGLQGFKWSPSMDCTVQPDCTGVKVYDLVLVRDSSIFQVSGLRSRRAWPCPDAWTHEPPPLILPQLSRQLLSLHATSMWHPKQALPMVCMQGLGAQAGGSRGISGQSVRGQLPEVLLQPVCGHVKLQRVLNSSFLLKARGNKTLWQFNCKLSQLLASCWLRRGPADWCFMAGQSCRNIASAGCQIKTVQLRCWQAAWPPERLMHRSTAQNAGLEKIVTLRTRLAYLPGHTRPTRCHCRSCPCGLAAARRPPQACPSRRPPA